jgi:hypothetical protein
VNALLLTLALGAAWSDPTGHLSCPVPDTFTARPQQPWVFTRGDGLRQLVFVTVRPIAEGPDARAAQLLERVPKNEALAAAISIAPLQPTWAGVIVLGPPAADVQAEARTLIAGCTSVLPVIDGDHIRDSTRRLSAVVPQGLTAVEMRGSGAVQAPGFSIRLNSLQPRPVGALSEIATQWLVPTGARLESAEDTVVTQRGLLASIATGTMVQNGADYTIAVAIVDFGNGEVGGLSLSTHAATRTHALNALREMLRSIAAIPPAPQPLQQPQREPR